MNPVSVSALASVFTIGGALVGLPSLATLVAYGLITLYQRLSPLPRPSGFGTNPDAVLLVLQGITQVIGGLARLLGSLAQLVLDLAAVAAGASFAFGLLCWWIGRGLHAHATWARFGAGALLTVLLLVAGLLALSSGGPRRLVPMLIVVVAALGLHALWVGERALAP